MKKWKMNWGTGLALTLGVFVLAMVFVMYKATQQRFDLVTTDYYEEELAYQETIDRKERALQLKEDCVLKIEEGQLHLDFPSQLEGQKARAEVLMYCLTDARKDFSLKEENWAVKDITLPAGKLSSGKWIAKVTLDAGNDKYYFDPEIVIP